ncbi:3'-phosphoadenosine 5'-phosphosulfate sulfotransferase [Ceratobasidium sp. 394]|nr:3'-phosphoadenosine 5'-phosphosulfate sulfotransferase [Ceratobasidium sp. 394]KAG9085253.1 3'-phosphoadenosine 5'-phosphosulfate sulfotransferase [Ceratobasidium sp. UAMH 11750]
MVFTLAVVLIGAGWALCAARSHIVRGLILEGIGCGSKCTKEDTALADSAVVLPSLSNATLSTLRPIAPFPPSRLPPIRSVYVLCPSPFVAVDEFVEASAKSYNLQLVQAEGSTKVALQSYLDTPGGTGVEAVLVGTRRNDPHGAKPDFLQHCDPGCPRCCGCILLLIGRIGRFESTQGIRSCRARIVICTMNGQFDYLNYPCTILTLHFHLRYTSLGSTYSTFKNSALPILKPGIAPTWLPAYAIEDGTLELTGRANGTGIERRTAGDAPAATLAPDWSNGTATGEVARLGTLDTSLQRAGVAI